ncbi:MAG: deoxyribonuclease V [Bacteroidota bacterium]
MSDLLHPWEVSPKEAVVIQKGLRQHLRIQPLDRAPELLAGVDLSYEIGGKELWAAFVLLDPQSLEVVGWSGVKDAMRFPYVPGLLSFREVPALMKAWEQLDPKPDLIMVDGHGYAHPRRMGIACHLGLLTGTPAMGCGKNILVGKHPPLEETKGAAQPLLDGEELVGYVLRTRTRVKPMYISAGHLMDQDSAKRAALQAVSKYRMPEPTRQAHLLVNRLRRGELAPGMVWKGAT